MEVPLLVVVQIVGLLATLLGALATVPDILWHPHVGFVARAKVWWIKSKAWLFRLLRIRGADTAQSVALSDSASAKDSLSVEVTHAVGDTTAERLAALERRLDDIERHQGALAESVRMEIAARARLADTSKAEAQQLEALVRDLDETNARINVRAFPVVFWGILLTTVPEWLASASWLGRGCAVVGIALSVWAAHSVWKARPRLLVSP